MELSIDHKPQRLPSEHVKSLSEIESGYWWYRGRIYWATALLNQTLPKNPSSLSYADLGCGTGGFGSNLQKHFNFERCALVDGDTNALDLINDKKDRDILERNLCSAFSLPWSPNVVSCMDVIEHLEDDTGFLQHAHSIMAKNGTLLISVPAVPRFYSEWDRALGHYRRYSKSQLVSVVEQAGFKTLQVKYMWSFITPAVLYRKFFGTQKYQESTEIQPIPNWMNQLLFKLGQAEFHFSKRITLPLGMSLMLIATRKTL